MEMKLAKESGEKAGVRDLLARRLGAGSKVKPKVAKALFKKWLEWEERCGDKKGSENVQILARGFAEAAAKEKVNEERKAMIEGNAEG